MFCIWLALVSANDTCLVPLNITDMYYEATITQIQTYVLIPFISASQEQTVANSQRSIGYNNLNYFIGTGFRSDYSPTDTKVNFLKSKGCPMFGSITNVSCLYNESGYILGNDADFLKERITDMYPKCDSLVKYLPCSVYYPTIRNMLQLVSYNNQTNSRQTVFNLRVCHNYAEKLYKYCRFVPFKKQWIVDPKMGYNEFLDKLGISQFDRSTDDPMNNCWDYQGE